MLRMFRKTSNGAGSGQPFNIVKVIQAHLDQKEQVEGFVFGWSKEKPAVSWECPGDCLFAQWLHGEGGRLCNDAGLLDSLHNSCEQFHAAASQAVSLVLMGKPEMAREVLEEDDKFSGASDRYLDDLNKLYFSCRLNQ